MILVIAEQKDGKLNRASVETIAAAQQLSMPIKIAVAGQNVGSVAAELAQYGEVIAVDHAALAHYTPDAFVQALQQVITQAAPAGLAARQKIVALYAPQKAKQTVMITGSAAEAAKELVKRLREEARVL